MLHFRIRDEEGMKGVIEVGRGEEMRSTDHMAATTTAKKQQ